MRLFDLHCDTLYEIYKRNEILYENNLCVSIKKAKKYELYIGCFSIWIPEIYKADQAFYLFKKIFSKFNEEKQKNDNYIEICKGLNDFKKINRSPFSKEGIILTIEGSSLIGQQIDRIKYLYDCGVRMITLTWNGSNQIGDGISVENAKGISNFGIKALKEMEKLRIIVDVSHASEKLFYDVAQISNRPFIASHSNSYSVCRHERNIKDDQFNIIKSSGGIIGINFYKKFLNEDPDASLCDIMKHIEHFMSLSGENVIAIGSDFDGSDVIDPIKDIGSLSILYEYLLRHNYSEKLVDNIFFNNAYNFFENYFSY